MDLLHVLGGPILARTVFNVAGPAVAGAAGAVAALLLLLTDRGQVFIAKLALPLWGLFSRIDRNQALDHPHRAGLVDFVAANPGRSLRDAAAAVGVARATAAHHGRVLERQGLIRIHRDGYRARLYPGGPPVLPDVYVTQVQQRVLRAVRSKPGATQGEISQAVGLPRKNVAYHVARLTRARRVRVDRRGRAVRHYPAGDGEAEPSVG